jgi:hypothetical protein
MSVKLVLASNGRNHNFGVFDSDAAAGASALAYIRNSTSDEAPSGRLGTALLNGDAQEAIDAWKEKCGEEFSISPVSIFAKGVEEGFSKAAEGEKVIKDAFTAPASAPKIFGEYLGEKIETVKINWLKGFEASLETCKWVDVTHGFVQLGLIPTNGALNPSEALEHDPAYNRAVHKLILSKKDAMRRIREKIRKDVDSKNEGIVTTTYGALLLTFLIRQPEGWW